MAKKNTIKRVKTSNKQLETDLATAYRLLREARAHIGFEMAGDQRYVGAEGWDDEPVDAWFAEVDQLVGPAFPGGGVQAGGVADQGSISDSEIEDELSALLGC